MPDNEDAPAASLPTNPPSPAPPIPALTFVPPFTVTSINAAKARLDLALEYMANPQSDVQIVVANIIVNDAIRLLGGSANDVTW